jgi:hypothetical protein
MIKIYSKNSLKYNIKIDAKINTYKCWQIGTIIYNLYLTKIGFKLFYTHRFFIKIYYIMKME